MSRPWARSPGEVLRALGAQPDRGLDTVQARERRRRFGPNRLREARARSAGAILADQFKNLIILLLVVAAAVSFAFGERNQGVAIAAVIAINAAIGFVTELRAARSMEALRRLGRVTARVRRQGRVQEIRAEDLVPGDLVVVEGGDIVSADLRLVEASRLQADESALTGESAPVGKRVEALAPDTALAERASMLFQGTAITRGSGEGVVVATGMATELGRIASLAEEAEEERTPLEKRLDRLGHRLIWVTLAIGVAVALAGIMAGKGALLMVETGIALAVATIPEGLPVVATIALARGMWRMARRNALVNRLSVVETLGATTIICTDKTGTLTENRMTVVRVALAREEIAVGAESGREAFTSGGRPVPPPAWKALDELLEVGVLCSNASLVTEAAGRRGLGDPLEVALLEAGARAGLDRDRLVQRLPEVREEAFDPDVKMMATVHREDSGYRVCLKGAPEAVLDVCSRVRVDGEERGLSAEERQEWAERSARMAGDGLRVLALATNRLDAPDALLYEDLVLLGLVGLSDPPRWDVEDAVAACRRAGIRVVMVTGDQPATARAVARAVGLIGDDEVTVAHGREIRPPGDLSEDDRRRLLDAAVYARVTPRQKLDLVALHQQAGAVVAMTGDGVNDAPALRKADIGVAMGRRGTQVAREAADMVLKDDAFGTIVAAVREGRAIFENIRAFVLYLLSCNVSEILVVGLASLVNAPLPIRPLQILFLNLVTDVFPALALGVGEGDPAAMARPPRDPREPILTRRHWRAVGAFGAAITAAVLGAFTLGFLGLEMGERQAVTVSFLTLAFAQLGHVFNMPGAGRNPFVWLALAFCAALLVAVVYVVPLAGVLQLVDPGVGGWALIAVMSVVPAGVGRVFGRP